MKRLSIVAACAALAAGAGWAALSARADDKKPADHAKHFDECAKVCADCQVACEKNFHTASSRWRAGRRSTRGRCT
jgi:hypothetical protein